MMKKNFGMCAFLFFFLSINSKAIAVEVIGNNEAGHLKMMTMNVHCLNDNWKWRYTQILNKLIELSPDVVSFQEVCVDKESKDGTQNGINFIRDYLLNSGYGLQTIEAQYTHDAWDRFGEYLVILSKHKAQKIEKGFLPLSLLPRGFVALFIDGAFYINTHLEYRRIDAEIRKTQIQFLIDRFNDRPHVIMGDFNSSPISYEQSTLSDRNYFPFFPGKTFNGGTDGETRIDGFWYDPRISREIKTISGKIILNELMNGAYLSDHFGVFTEFVLR